MFRTLLLTTAVAAGAAAYFMPIDPALLKFVGLDNIGASDTGAGQTDVSSGNPVRRFLIVAGNSSAQSVGQATGSTRADAENAHNPASGTLQGAQSNANNTAFHVTPLRVASAPRIHRTLPSVGQPDPSMTSGLDYNTISRSLQHELRRVGCYDGRIDGDWGPSSRFAMAAFVRAVNAQLPTERPDEVLLSLVRRHAGMACVQGRKSPTVETVARTPLGLSGWSVRVRRSASSTETVEKQRSASTRPVPVPRIVSSGRTVASDRSDMAEVRVTNTRVLTTGSIVRGQGVAQRRPSANFGQPRMSLGVPTRSEPQSTEPPSPVTTQREPETQSSDRSRSARSRRSRSRETSQRRYHRSRSTSGRTYYRSRRSTRGRRAWRQRVYRGVNLSGN